MLGKSQMSCSALFTLLLLATPSGAQSNISLPSSQSTWGMVPESSSTPSTAEEPAWRTAQNFPKYGTPTPADGQPTPLVGQPTPADPVDTEPGTLNWPSKSAGDNFDSQPGILSGPVSEPSGEPRYDSNLSIGPGGYARIPEANAPGRGARLSPSDEDAGSSFILGPNGEMMLDQTGAWPGTPSVCPPPAPAVTKSRFPVFRSFCCRNFPVMSRGAHRLLSHPSKPKPCPPQATTAPWFYGGFEYLHWWTRGMTVPSVMTTSPDGTPIGEAGVLGFPTTNSLLGPGRLDVQDNAGGRFNFGFYLDPCHCSSIESDFFLLEGSRFSPLAQSPQEYAILARPYFNTISGMQDAELVGYPGITEGSVVAVGETDFLGGGVALRRNLYCGSGVHLGGGKLSSHLAGCFNGIDNGCGWACSKLQWLPGGGLMPIRVDGIVGWRAYELQEQFTITENRTATDPMGADPVGTATTMVDQFETRNTFNGAVFGTDADWSHGRWGVASRLRVSLGQMRRRASIAGRTTVTTPGVATASYNAGLQALASNIGSYADNEFVAVPEVGFDAYYLLRPHMRIKAGYTFMYLTDVWRPGTVLDTSLDPRLIPPPTVATAANPAFVPRSDDFWAQGINLGVEWRY